MKSSTYCRSSPVPPPLTTAVARTTVVAQEVERLRRERNAVANKMKGKLEPSERQKLIEEGKNLKEGLANLEEDLIKLTGELQMEAQCIPNMTHPDVPIGGEDCSALMYRKICNIGLYFDN